MGETRWTATKEEVLTLTKVALYSRVSTKDKGQEIENQLVQLREFAVKQGWEIFKVYADYESGSTDDRPEFKQLFQDASQRRFDVVLFWALDRLSREGVLETLQHLNRLASYGVGYKSFTEQYFDSCGIFKDAVIAIVATVAKQERIRISERVRAGLATAKAQGKRLGRPRVAFSTARIARLQAEGHSLRAISKQLGISLGTVHAAVQKTSSPSCSQAAEVQ